MINKNTLHLFSDLELLSKYPNMLYSALAEEVYFYHFKRLKMFDMAKKFLHMGFTRSRRYANHRDGKKWTKNGGEWKVLPQELDAMTCEKAESAEIFKAAWKEARENKTYLKMKKNWRKK